MSEPVTAVAGPGFAPIATLTELPPQGMITLRCDLADRAVGKAVTSLTGAKMPGPGTVETAEDHAVCWMSPDELLVLCAHEAVTDRLAALREALGKVHALAVKVSDARASFALSGAQAREVMAKLCPVDLAPGAFEPGQFRRTRMAQVPAAFWMTDQQTFRIVCFQSQQQYVRDVLTVAAQPGSGVNYY